MRSRASLRSRLLSLSLVLLLLLAVKIVDSWAAAPMHSLYPSRDPHQELEALDDELAPHAARLSLEHWRPYGLPSSQVNRLQLRWNPGGLGLNLAIEQQDWGVLRAQLAELDLILRGSGPLRLGLGTRIERLATGQVTQSEPWAMDQAAAVSSGRRGPPLAAVELLLGRRGALAPSLRLLLWQGRARGLVAPRRALLGLSLARDAWTLRIHRGLGPRQEVEDGLAIIYHEGAYEIGLSAGSPVGPGLELGLNTGRWRWLIRARVHADLGLSQGLAVQIR